MFIFVFFFKQKTAYEMRISDWSSDVCSSDLSTCRTRAFAAKLVAVQWTFSDIGLIAVAVDRAAGQTHREVVGQRQIDAELRFIATVAAIARHEIAAERAPRTLRRQQQRTARGIAPEQGALRPQIGRAHV